MRFKYWPVFIVFFLIPKSGKSEDKLYLPFSPNDKWQITWSWTDSEWHTPGWAQYGLDFQRQEGPGATFGSSVNAAGGGKVIADKLSNTGYGNHVVIDHGNGYATIYGHMQSVSVKPGDTVTATQKIGEAGATGNVSSPTAAHIHFEVREFSGGELGKAVNPESLLGRTNLADATPKSPKKVSFTVNELIGYRNSQKLASDIGQNTARLFGGSSERPLRRAFRNLIQQPQPTPRPDPVSSAMAPAESGTFNGVGQTMGPFNFSAPQGWNFERTQDGGLTMKSGQAFVTFFPYPPMAGFAYNAESVSRFMMGEWMAGTQRTLAPGVATFACPVGKDSIPGVRRERSNYGGLTGHVAFDHQGTVYIVSYNQGGRQAAQKLVQSISMK